MTNIYCLVVSCQFGCTRVALKVTPPILLSLPMISKVDVGGVTVHIKSFHQQVVTSESGKISSA